ncbi:MAG: hypothetical protein AAF591_14425 [Verrucomicrobiota bacterium]
MTKLPEPRIVKENESFVALVTGDLYAIEQFHLSTDVDNFSAILDRNVYTRITSLIRGDEIPPHSIGDFRWAAAVLAFCQIADFKFQYGASLQEYASKKGGESAASDFECFYRADNCDPQAFIDFAVGRVDVLDSSSIADLEPCPSIPEATRFEEPIYDFRLNYILALKVATLSYRSDSPHKLMIEFIDWMDSDFICAAGALQFANLYFSPARKKRMLKKRTPNDVQNAAWDLAMIQSWRRCALKGNASGDPVVLITRDKAVRFIAERLVATDLDEFKGQLVTQWKPRTKEGNAIFDRYMELHSKLESRSSPRPRFPDDELDTLTADLEEQLTMLNGT